MTVQEFIAEAKRIIARFGEPSYGGITWDDINTLIERFYELPGNSQGGKLHIVLDDTNLETHFIEACREDARDENDEPAFLVAQLLLMLTEEERASLEFVCPCCRNGDELIGAWRVG